MYTQQCRLPSSLACQTTPQVISTGLCSIHGQMGLYQLQQVAWQDVVGCQCVNKRKQVKQLCACLPPHTEERCLDTITLARYTTNYVRNGDQCHATRQVQTSEVRKWPDSMVFVCITDELIMVSMKGRLFVSESKIAALTPTSLHEDLYSVLKHFSSLT